jgi:hypothetical protein
LREDKEAEQEKHNLASVSQVTAADLQLFGEV